MLKKTLSLLFACIMLLVSINGTILAFASGNMSIDTENIVKLDTLKTEKLNKEAKAGHSDNEKVRIMVRIEGDAALEKAGDVKSAEKYQSNILDSQKKAISKIEDKLDKKLENKKQFSLLFNGFSFDGTAQDIDAINSMSGMLAFTVPEFSLPEPTMDTSSVIVGAPYAWDLGYTGEGTAIAIIDTGIRSTHKAFSVMPKNIKFDIDTVSSIVADNSETLHAGIDVEQLYKNDKIPFGYDYAYDDYTPEHTVSDHGTHVAGIAAGNNGSDFHGIAYDAQIFVMQVFKNGSASWDVLLSALEDCAYLGVDSANMSLGSPCGFTTYADESFEQAFSLLSKAGILVAAAAGNDASTAKNNGRGGYQLAANPDNGLVGSPSTLYPCLSVASSDNRTATSGYIYAYAKAIGYKEPTSGASEFYQTLQGSCEYVYCGLGNTDEIPSSVAGRIALVQRGDLTFTEKAANAYAAGAKGIIVYNNQPGSYQNISVTSSIPFVTISDTDGEFLLENAENGIGKLEVRPGDAGAAYDTISSFSSRGTTSDLKIKPEITAPGGAITSAIGFGTDTSYATWNGTSMATPHVAGGMAIVKSYVNEKMPNLSNEEVSKIVNSILMGTATPLNSELVTEQGAGIMNLEGAVNTNTYITVNGERPKLELDDSVDCKWDYKVELTNFGTEAVQYKTEHLFTIENPLSKDVSGDPDVYVTNGSPLNITQYVSVTGDETVTVPAGETVTVSFSIDAHEVMEQYGHCFPAGARLEGFLKFISQDEELSVPILGFMGDWDYPSVFDRGFYWQVLTEELNLNSNGSISYNLAATQKNNQISGIGFNPYVDETGIEKFNPDWGALSPDGDGNFDTFSYLKFAILRNLKDFSIVLDTPSDTVTIFETESYDYVKEYYSSSQGYSYSSIDIDYAGEGLNEGETAYIRVLPILDHEGYSPKDNEMGEWVIPVTLDTTAPSLFLDGHKIGVYDEHYVAYTAIYSDAEMHHLICDSSYYGDTRGDSYFIEGSENITGTVYVFVGDYAGNDIVYAVDLDSGEILTETDEYLMTFIAGDKVCSQTKYHAGDKVEMPEDPTVDGYDFIGWDSEIPEIMPEHNVVIHAVLEEIPSFTVTFMDWDGTVLDIQTVKRNEAAQAPVDPEREGHDFVGWDKDFSNVTEDMTVTAVYAVLQYTVRFIDGISGEEIPSLSYVTNYGSELILPEPPEVPGYTFIRWDTDVTIVTCDMTIVGLYEVTICTVTFTDGLTGEILGTVSVEYGQDVELPPVPKHDGYTFIGWSETGKYIVCDTTIVAQYMKYEYTLGDVNMDDTVNTADAVMILKHSAELIQLSSEQMLLADVNKDENVNTSDAVYILRFAVGLETL